MASSAQSGAPPAAASAVEELVLALHSIHAICLDGPYTLKSGLQSPFYIDLRLIISHPKILQQVASAMYSLVRSRPFDLLCGVPYTALPIATLLSVTHTIPMVLRRKEGSKAYGLKKALEGTWREGQRVLVVEDLVTSGQSVFETIEPLRENGLRVEDIVVLINREQGGRENIEARGMRLHAVVTISEVMEILERHGRIGKETVQKVQEFIRASQVEIKSPEPALVSPTPPSTSRLPYSARIAHCRNSAGRALLRLMELKRSNLCLSADCQNKRELLDLADRAGPYICMLKTHVDLLSDWDASVSTALQTLAASHRFLLFEDRKYADIGSTVAQQYAGGVYRTADWAHVVNAHAIAGPGIIRGLQQAVAAQLERANRDDEAEPRGLLLIAEMSSEGALATGAYTEANVQMAEANQEFVFGFICQHALSKQPGLLHLSPGVQLPPADAEATSVVGASSSAAGTAVQRVGTDSLGQQYHSPRDIIGTRGSDVIIVGRAIVKAQDVAAECQRYQQAGWQAYEESLRA